MLTLKVDLRFPSQPDSDSQIQLSAIKTPDAKYWSTSRVCAFSPTVHSSPMTAGPVAELYTLIFKFSDHTTIEFEGLITNADKSAYREEVDGWLTGAPTMT